MGCKPPTTVAGCHCSQLMHAMSTAFHVNRIPELGRFRCHPDANATRATTQRFNLGGLHKLVHLATEAHNRLLSNTDKVQPIQGQRRTTTMFLVGHIMQGPHKTAWRSYNQCPHTNCMRGPGDSASVLARMLGAATPSPPKPLQAAAISAAAAALHCNSHATQAPP
jgi:hypothetical protein